MDCEVRKLRRISRTPIKSNKKVGVNFEEECVRNIKLSSILEDIRPNYNVFLTLESRTRYV
jgi:hypothetical protein